MIIGPAITEDIVRQDPRYVNKEPMTLSHISAYTMEQQSVHAMEALQRVDLMKQEYGNGISALIRIYNASGETLFLVTSHDWHGHMWKYPADPMIQNGQWSVFLHVHYAWAMVGASGAAVYKASQANQDVFLGWQSPYIGTNSVYVESREPKHWPKGASWDYMYDKKIDADGAGSNSFDAWGNIKVSGQVGQNSSPLVDFVIRHA